VQRCAVADRAAIGVPTDVLFGRRDRSRTSRTRLRSFTTRARSRPSGAPATSVATRATRATRASRARVGPRTTRTRCHHGACGRSRPSAAVGCILRAAVCCNHFGIDGRVARGRLAAVVDLHEPARTGRITADQRDDPGYARERNRPPFK
jgi:hypothetical protein